MSAAALLEVPALAAVPLPATPAVRPAAVDAAGLLDLPEVRAGVADAGGTLRTAH